MRIINKNIKLLFKFLILFLIVGCAEDKRNKIIESHSNGKPKVLKEYVKDGNVSDYLIKKFTGEGTLTFVGKVRDNKFVDYKKSFYPNGNIKEIVKLSNSAELKYCCPDGFYELYNEEGVLEETHYMKNGLFNGMVVQFNPNGWRIGEYSVKDDVKNGVSKLFYPNGNIKSIKEYENDTLVGTVFYFTESGDSLKRYGIYNGKMDFPIKYWKEDGSNLMGEYLNSSYHHIKWIWKDSLNSLLKIEILEVKNGQFVTPDF